jgi:predicted TIM-barrel fold metal-dependent hydrolase
VDRLLFVSADGHATMPPALWPEYLERAYHEHLPRLTEENRRFTDVMRLLNDYDLIYEGVLPGSHYDVFDQEGLFRDGQWAGAWDRDVRLAQMDREGVAAEFVFNGYFRATDLFFNVSNTVYPVDVAQAGVRAYHRWLAETFGADRDRLLLVGTVGRCLDVDEVVRETAWVADNGFAATYAPGFTSHPDLVPLDDPSWEPFWALCADRGLPLVVHGGYGFEPGFSYGSLTRVYTEVRDAGGSDEDAVRALRSGVFNDGFFTDLRGRQVLWRLMLSGVFDRHPGLRLMMTEVRADWVPAALRSLDRIFEEHRDTIPAQRKPSEYWERHCMAGLSFMHRSEIEMRHEIGIETLSFGRDYPHTEGTWPNTKDYLRTLFAGLPEDEVRLILGENLARFLELDLAHLAPLVDRIGLGIHEVLDPAVDLDPNLLAHFDARCGLSKPAEGDRRVEQMEPLVRDDLARMGVR